VSTVATVISVRGVKNGAVGSRENAFPVTFLYKHLKLSPCFICYALCNDDILGGGRDAVRH
jgi:hypothetical protein